MNIRISEAVREEMGPHGILLVGRRLLERSFQHWLAGVRTRRRDCPKDLWPIRFQGRNLSGEFLVSTYVGATYTVITTPTDQWLLLTAEMEQHRLLGAECRRRATPFGFLLFDDSQDPFVE